MNIKRKKHSLFLVIVLAAVLQACESAPTVENNPPSDVVLPTMIVGDIPTWTPRPQDLPASPTETKQAPVSPTQTAISSVTDTPSPPPTPEQVLFKVVGGNLNVRRGPGLTYNYFGALYDGDVAIAIGRDRISRWVMVELPSSPGKTGWVTTETDYSVIEGDVSSLPFISVEPAVSASIRNCTDHTMLILPDDVQLLPRANEPYNEDNFYIGIHQVVDLDASGTVKLDDISLLEGRSVDIIINGDGVKSKCE